MVAIRFTREAVRQFGDLPTSIRSEFDEIFPFLERNPMDLPRWVDQKLMGELRGKKVLRLRVRDYRGVFTFDRDTVTFVRFGPRLEVYSGLPKI